jgi:hypothetical protein
VNSVGKGLRLGNQIQPGDLAIWQSLMKTLTKTPLARSELDNAVSRRRTTRHGFRDPTRIPHKRIDKNQISPTPDGARISRVQRIEEFRSEDTIESAHGFGEGFFKYGP